MSQLNHIKLEIRIKKTRLFDDESPAIEGKASGCLLTGGLPLTSH